MRKSSSLALLVHDVQDWDGGGLSGTRIQSMHEKAEQVWASFGTDGERVQFHCKTLKQGIVNSQS